MTILSLRDKAKEALGEKFDIKAFDWIILETGAIPMKVLEQLIDDWILEQQNA